MKRIFTHDDFESLIAKENELKHFLSSENLSYEKNQTEPSEKTLHNIFNYSKALSVKKSDLVDEIEMILN